MQMFLFYFAVHEGFEPSISRVTSEHLHQADP